MAVFAALAVPSAMAVNEDGDAEPSTESVADAAEAKNLRPEATDKAKPAKEGTAKAAADTDLGAPAHRKYIKDNGDGTYWLSLDVTGASRASTEQKNQPADVVLVMDSSGSMASCADPNGGWGCDTRWDIAKADAATLAQKLLTAANAALPQSEQVQMSVVDFDTTSTIMRFGSSQWSTSAADISRSFNSMDASSGNGGGTNWEAALRNANSLNTGRAGVQKYIIFVSDGAPTFRNSSMGVTCSGWFDPDDCSYYQSDGVYGTGSGDSNGYNFTAAVNEAGKRSGATLYAVSTGSEANDKMSQFADRINPTGTFFDGTDADKLSAAFDSIVQQIQKSSMYRDVLITDVLSDWAVCTDSRGGTGCLQEVSARDKDGNDVTTSDPAAKSMKNDYDPASKTITLNFPNETKLSPDVIYTVSLKIKPTDEAYRYLIANNQYPNTGDQGTDAEGNTSSSGKPGFFSNAGNADGSTKANVSYKVVTNVNGEETVGPAQNALYDRPVIQVKVPSLTLAKGVNNTNAGAYGAQPRNWKLFALKTDDPAYGINPANPEGEAAAEGEVVSQSMKAVKLAVGTYTLGESADMTTGYRYFGGYTAGDWNCVDGDGKTVTVRSSGGKSAVTLTPGIDVTCTVINTAKPASMLWQKIDAHDRAAHLGGSEWTLQGPDAGGDTYAVIDNQPADATAKPNERIADVDQTSGDKQDGVGYLQVDGLKWGDYTLTETKAPQGYALPIGADATHKVSVLPGNEPDADPRFVVSVGEDGTIVNQRLAVSSLPLTGGTTGREWTIVGGGVAFVALAAVAASFGINEYRRRRGAMA
ncbi:DUF7604 domain-containing protein [Bifidobacterium margollesii]|uniref:DUF7604 domain-containing protein n=1 Tax=Bifidobacterium margollesii TaxID=2020964 RepID=UPI0013FD8C8F|nr:VWA domain-containing protein [Bifidobacterium margollesii]